MDSPESSKQSADGTIEVSQGAAHQDAASEAPVDDTNEDSTEEYKGWWDHPPAAECVIQEPTLLNPPGAEPEAPVRKLGFKLPPNAAPTPPQTTPPVSAAESGADWASLLAKATESPRITLDGKRGLGDEIPGGPPAPRRVVKLNDPPKETSPPKSFGRSAEVQDAPLHDSWSSRGDGLPPSSKKISRPQLASPEPLHESWSSGERTPEQGVQKTGWAAALQAAREPAPVARPLHHDAIQPQEPADQVAPESIPELEPTTPEDQPEEQPESQPESAQESGTKGTKETVGLYLRRAAILLVLVGLGWLAIASHRFFAAQTVKAPGNPIAKTEPLPTDDASIWLASAQESLESEDFELAIPQLQKAIGFLKNGQGENGQLKKTQVLLAETYAKVGDYGASANLWTQLAKKHLDLREKGKAAADASLRRNRLIANDKVKVGERAIKSKNFHKAIEVAEEALEIYKSSKGTNSQMARAHGIVGDAYRGKKNTRTAISHFTEAHRLDPSGRYRSELGRLRIPARPRPRRKAVKAKPTFVTKSSVPRGNARRHVPPPRRSIKAR